MTSPVKVYGPAMSTAVSRVLACLLEKEVDFQLIPVNMSEGGHKKPEFLKIQVQYNFFQLEILSPTLYLFLSYAFFLFFFFFFLYCNSPLAKYQLFRTTTSPSSVNYIYPHKCLTLLFNLYEY